MNYIPKKLIALSSIILGASFIGSNCFFFVNPGERAIIFDVVNGGVKERVYGRGIHFKIPLINRVIKYETRINPYDYTTFTGTKDLQKVNIKIKIFYRPDENYIKTIHLDLNKN